MQITRQDDFGEITVSITGIPQKYIESLVGAMKDVAYWSMKSNGYENGHELQELTDTDKSLEFEALAALLEREM